MQGVGLVVLGETSARGVMGTSEGSSPRWRDAAGSITPRTLGGLRCVASVLPDKRAWVLSFLEIKIIMMI